MRSPVHQVHRHIQRPAFIASLTIRGMLFAGIGTATTIYNVSTVPVPAGWGNVALVGINNSGQVAGYGSNPDRPAGGVISDTYQAFVATVSSFSTIPIPAGLSNSVATGINSSGQVVGNGVDGTGNNHGFVGTPAGSTAIPVSSPFFTASLYGINDSGLGTGYGLINWRKLSNRSADGRNGRRFAHRALIALVWQHLWIRHQQLRRSSRNRGL